MTTSSKTGIKLWFLTGSQHLIGDEVLHQVEQHSREILRYHQLPISNAFLS